MEGWMEDGRRMAGGSWNDGVMDGGWARHRWKPGGWRDAWLDGWTGPLGELGTSYSQRKDARLDASTYQWTAMPAAE